MRYVRRKKKLKKKLLFLILISSILTCIILFTYRTKYSWQISTEALKVMDYIDVSEKDKIVKDEHGKNTGVEFDAFFLNDKDGDGIADGIRGTCKRIGEKENIYIELAVQEEGYIKDSVITINANNFYFNTTLVKDNEIAKNYISSNTKEIELNRINNGTQKLIIASICSGDYSSSTTKTSAIGNDISNYSKDSTITFSGVFVNDKGEESRFEKIVPLTVDWYGDVNCDITPKTQKFNNLEEIKKDDGLHLDFTITTIEDLNQLIMSGSYISGTIPELNGYKPDLVKIEGNNVTYTYDRQTGNFTAQREAVLEQEKIIIQNAYTSSNADIKKNEFNFSIIYPLEAYNDLTDSNSSVEIAIPVEAINKGFNNTSMQTPAISDTVNGIIVATWKKEYNQGTIWKTNFWTSIGEYRGEPYNTNVIFKKKPLNLYNGISLEENDDIYEVNWGLFSGTYGESDGLIMCEQKADEFLTDKDTYKSMNDFTNNIGIKFNTPIDLLGEDGWIEVYNAETDELVEKFTIQNWNETYYYKEPIKHIRVETSKTNQCAWFIATSIKEIDDEYIVDNIEKEQFDSYIYAYTYLDGFMKRVSETTKEEEYFNKQLIYNKAMYVSPSSIAKISIDDDVISTKSIEENRKITISTKIDETIQEGWKNGIFLVQLPNDIVYTEINNITIDNEDVSILAYDVYTDIHNGKENYYIKILTENKEKTSYNIVIDCNLVPDARVIYKEDDILLYAINEEASDYIYNSNDEFDLDGDSNQTELVNYSSTQITFNPGSSLNTTQTATNFNNNNQNIVIAPRVAVVDGNRTAKISIIATNYYEYNLSDINIVGVIPFEGNKSILTENDLGSEYNTYMTKKGISVVTDSLKDKVKIYYSTNEQPSNDETIEWIASENVTDWSKIKSYKIKLNEDYDFNPNETIEFSYEILIPDGVDYNEVSYSEHAIYFSLLTESGKHPTQIQSSKLGFMIAKQYSLEIEKYQKNTEKRIEGVFFSLTECEIDKTTNTIKNNNKSIIKITDQNGKIVIPELFAEKYYILKEQRTTNDYLINNEEIRFYTYTTINEDKTESLHLVYVEDDGSYLNLEDKYKSVRSTSIILPTNNQNYTIKIAIENEVKPKLAIYKKNESNQALKNVKFKLFNKDDLKKISDIGKDINDNDIDTYIANIGTIYTTDSNGKIVISGLHFEEEYALKEIKANGYYIPKDAIKFSIKNNEGKYTLDYIDNGSTISNEIIKENEIPIITLNLINTRIPTYGLQLTKYAKGEENKVLKKAQYKIYGEGIANNGKIYETDENGIFTIDELYEFSEDKDFSAEYTLVEVFAPEGYSINNTEFKFKAYRDDYGKLQIKILSGANIIRNLNNSEKLSDLTIENQEGEYPIIKIGVEDSQIFSIHKKDKDTNEPLAGAKFIITDLDGNFAKDTDGNIIGEYVFKDDKGYYVVTTDENGNFTANIGEGLYKAIEIEAPDRYILSENESERTYYFGIDASKPAQEGAFLKQVKGKGWNYINCVETLENGGIIATGSFSKYDKNLVSDGKDGIDVDGDGVIDKISNRK